MPTAAQSAASASDANSAQPKPESPQPSQTASDPSSPFGLPPASRLTLRPSVVADPPGQFQTALPLSGPAGAPLGAQSRQHSSNCKPTRHKSLDAAKPVGVVEAWQIVDVEADLVSVWSKYQEVFYGDYQPVPSTYRR